MIWIPTGSADQCSYPWVVGEGVLGGGIQLVTLPPDATQFWVVWALWCIWNAADITWHISQLCRWVEGLLGQCHVSSGGDFLTRGPVWTTSTCRNQRATRLLGMHLIDRPVTGIGRFSCDQPWPVRNILIYIDSESLFSLTGNVADERRNKLVTGQKYFSFLRKTCHWCPNDCNRPLCVLRNIVMLPGYIYFIDITCYTGFHTEV